MYVRCLKIFEFKCTQPWKRTRTWIFRTKSWHFIRLWQPCRSYLITAWLRCLNNVSCYSHEIEKVSRVDGKHTRRYMLLLFSIIKHRKRRAMDKLRIVRSTFQILHQIRGVVSPIFPCIVLANNGKERDKEKERKRRNNKSWS